MVNCLCYGKTFQLSFIKKAIFWGLPWRSSGWDSELPLQGARVQSLVGELGSRVPHGQKKKAILKKKKIYLIYFWLCWVFVAVHGLSLVAASGGYSSLQHAGFSLQWLLLLWSTGCRAQAQWLWSTGLVPPWHVGSSRTRG